MNASRRRFTQSACAIGVLPWLASCGGDDVPAVELEYASAVQGMVSTYFLPGVLAAVRRPGQRQWTGAFGKANLQSGAGLALGSTFPIRSVTKSFTVTIVLQLLREGLLTLDDTIDRYVPGMPNGHLITLADLAGMQSGLVDYSATTAFQDLFIPDLQRVWTEQELVDFSRAQPVVFQPGEQYQYSNANTVLLGMVVEAVTGQTLAAQLASRIFQPLGLRGTTYPTEPELPAPAPTPYGVDIGSGAADEYPLISPSSLAGAGALSSTLADLLTWGDELGSGSLVGPALHELRRTRSRPVTNGPEYANYGLGIGEIDGWWGHTGSGLGFQLACMNDPASGTTVAVMVNATPEGGRRDLNFAQEVFEALAAVVASA
ncbi:MAG: serine hydrolase domain-containing protein [Rubrivivax sp.]